MLTLNAVSSTLPDGRVLFQSVDLRITEDTKLAIVGPSGIGKSTLLAIIGGLLQPTHGLVAGTWTAAAAAWVLQDSAVFGRLTTMDNATSQAEMDGCPASQARERASTHLERVGLTPHATKRADVLSGGERQRLTVARALTSQRPIILADEPTSHLDRENAQQVMGALLDGDHSAAVVVVTHDIEALPPNVDVLRLTFDGLADV